MGIEFVDFHFDVMCPWAYQTSRWMREVRDLTGLEVRWRFFSLEEINRAEGKKHPWEREWSYGWSMLRIAALLRRKDPALVDAWYERAGRALHEEGRQPHRPEVAEELLAEIGIDPGVVAEAIADPSTHDDVRADHDRVVAAGGFGVPTLFFPDGQCLFGPVVVDPPTGDEALALWDARAVVAALPAALRDPAAEGARRPGADRRDVPAVPDGTRLADRSRTRRPERRRRQDARARAHHLPKEPVVAALHDVWDRLDDLLAGLDDADWQRPTCLPGWNVQAVAAHVIGTENMLLGVERCRPWRSRRRRTRTCATTSAASTRRGSRRSPSEPPADVLARFRDDVAQRKEALAAISDEEWDKVGFTPAGQDTYGRFMRIRVFDQWLHELDIRDAVGEPGGDAGPAAELALDEMAVAMGFVVGKKAGAPQGSRVRLDLTGDAGARHQRRGRPSGPPSSTSCRARRR